MFNNNKFHATNLTPFLILSTILFIDTKKSGRYKNQPDIKTILKSHKRTNTMPDIILHITSDITVKQIHAHGSAAGTSGR